MNESTTNIKDLGEYIGLLKGDLKGLKTAADEEIKSIENVIPPVKSKIITDLRGFITEQQEEYFRLHKELCILAKEKGDIEKEIKKSLDKIGQLEEFLGNPQANQQQ